MFGAISLSMPRRAAVRRVLCPALSCMVIMLKMLLVLTQVVLPLQAVVQLSNHHSMSDMPRRKEAVGSGLSTNLLLTKPGFNSELWPNP